MKSSGTDFGKEYFEKHYIGYSRRNPSYKLEFYKKLVEACINDKPGARILDIGCGVGAFLSYMNKPRQCFGSDIGVYAINRAIKHNPECRFFIADAAALPCKDAFDVIVAFDILEHVGNLECAARSIKTALSDCGNFIFVVPVYDGPAGPLIKLLDKDNTHIHRKSRAFWLEWAERHFRVIDLFGIYRYMLPGGAYIHVTSRKLRNISTAIAITVQKYD